MIDGKVLYDSTDFNCNDLEFEDVLNDLFNNKDENNTYVLVGTCGCCGGPEPYVKGFFDSIYEAIKSTYLRSDFELKVVSYPYGVLHIETSHHDGVNDFEVRQLTKKGYELYQYHYTVEEIVKMKRTTKNAHFSLGDNR